MYIVQNQGKGLCNQGKNKNDLEDGRPDGLRLDTAATP